jgi:hypothetical protein
MIQRPILERLDDIRMSLAAQRCRGFHLILNLLPFALISKPAHYLARDKLDINPRRKEKQPFASGQFGESASHEKRYINVGGDYPIYSSAASGCNKAVLDLAARCSSDVFGRGRHVLGWSLRFQGWCCGACGWSGRPLLLYPLRKIRFSTETNKVSRVCCASAFHVNRY